METTPPSGVGWRWRRTSPKVTTNVEWKVEKATGKKGMTWGESGAGPSGVEPQGMDESSVQLN